MATARSLIVFRATVAVCTALVFTFAAAPWIGFSESLYPVRGTFTFWVTITEPVIRDFRLTALIGEALFACARMMRT